VTEALNACIHRLIVSALSSPDCRNNILHVCVMLLTC